MVWGFLFWPTCTMEKMQEAIRIIFSCISRSDPALVLLSNAHGLAEVLSIVTLSDPRLSSESL